MWFCIPTLHALFDFFLQYIGVYYISDTIFISNIFIVYWLDKTTSAWRH